MREQDTPSRLLPVQAALFGAGAVVLFLTARPVLAPAGLVGNVIAQWGFLCLPVVAALVLTGHPVRANLGFRKVPPAVFAGAALVGLGTIALNGVVAWLQSFVLPVPVEALQRMAAQLSAGSWVEWVFIIVGAALTPAVCEEVVFRGILVEPFRGKAPGWVVIGAGSLIFGTMHWMPGTFFRVLPAAFSGAMIGWMVWVTRSLWVGVWMHLLNNALLLTAASAAPEVMPEDPSTTPHPATVALGLVFVALGARVVFGATPGAEEGGVPSTRSAPSDPS